MLLLLLMVMAVLVVATRTMIVIWRRLVVLVLVVTGVVPVFVLKVSARGVRKQVGEVIVRIVIVRGAIILLLQVVPRYDPLGSVRAVGGEGVRDSFGEQKVREFVRIPTATGPQIFATFVVAVAVSFTSCAAGVSAGDQEVGTGGVVRGWDEVQVVLVDLRRFSI